MLGKHRFFYKAYYLEIVVPNNLIWDFWANYYDRLWAQHFVLKPTRKLVCDHIMNTNCKMSQLLDLGCGIGQFVFEISNKISDISIIAIDPSNKMIMRAEREYVSERINYFCGDIESFSWPKNFDVITCMHVFPYIPQKDEALRKIYSLLKFGGRLLLVQPNTQNLYDKLWFSIVKLTTPPSEYLSLNILKEKLIEAGFVIGKVQQIEKNFLIPNINMVEALKI